MAINAQDVNWYRDYLEKEMTIMGVLSGFSIAVVGFVLKMFVEAQNSMKPPLDHRWFGAVGCLLFTIAALAFYQERSLLAWYSGQLALRQVDATWPTEPIREWLRLVDGWSTWIPYRVGWGAVIVGSMYFVMALGGTNETACPKAVPLVGSVLLCVFWMRVLYVYSLEDHPWKELKGSATPFRDLTRGKKQ